MSKIIRLENENISVEISTFGAEIQKLVAFGKEIIWQGDKAFWGGHSPVLFPICSSLTNGYFTYEGKKYDSFRMHGFAKKSEFEVLSCEKSSVTFSLSWNEEFLKAYPFKFEFKINYVLSKDNLKVYYIVENHDNKKMYFNVGAHEAYYLEGDFEDYSLEFEDERDYIDFTEFVNGGLGYGKHRIDLDNKKLHFDYDYYRGVGYKTKEGYDSPGSILLEDFKARRFNLLYKDEFVLSIYAKDFDYLVLWTVPGAHFIAIEPWNGITDMYDSDGDICKKKGIDTVEPNEAKIFYHSISF